MTAIYDPIAADFQKTWEHPYRTHAEMYSFFARVGDLRGRSVLDLACGEGTYSRALKRHGAARVVGVDISPGMIELARAAEAREPLGIEYQVQDVGRLALAETFDLVTAVFLLNHARTADELQAMCRAIAAALKPGGRFLGINNNLDQPPESYAGMRKYGYTKRVTGPLREGTPITLIMFVGERTIQFDDCYLSRPTYEAAFRAAGLKNLRWHLPTVSPAGEAELGREYWQDFLNNPPLVLLECDK